MKPKTEEINDFESEPIEPQSDLSHDVKKLKTSVNRVIQERAYLPQPLFWSLFNSKIKELRGRKESTRRIEDLLSK